MILVHTYPNIVSAVSNHMGIIPAIIIPVSFAIQLIKIIRNKSCFGVSRFTWLLQFIGQLGFYLLVGKHTHIYSILAYGVSCCMALFMFVYCSIKKD